MRDDLNVKYKALNLFWTFLFKYSNRWNTVNRLCVYRRIRLCAKKCNVRNFGNNKWMFFDSLS